MPRPSASTRIRSAVSSSGSPKNVSAPASENAISSRRMTPAVARLRPPSPSRSPLPSSDVRYWMTARRSLRSSRGSPALSAKWNTSAEGRRLHVAQAEDLRQQHRPERRHRGAHRHASSLAPRGEELDRGAGRRPLLPDVSRTRCDPVADLAGHCEPRQVALDVGHEDRHAVRGELLGHQLERFGLARAGGTGDETVPVQHRQRDADAGVGDTTSVDDQGTQLEGRTIRCVPGPDGVHRRIVRGRGRVPSGGCDTSPPRRISGRMPVPGKATPPDCRSTTTPSCTTTCSRAAAPVRRRPGSRATSASVYHPSSSVALREEIPEASSRSVGRTRSCRRSAQRGPRRSCVRRRCRARRCRRPRGPEGRTRRPARWRRPGRRRRCSSRGWGLSTAASRTCGPRFRS